jgi:oligopeptide/dipeptide ABC transporter ATP-binding protein
MSGTQPSRWQRPATQDCRLSWHSGDVRHMKSRGAHALDESTTTPSASLRKRTGETLADFAQAVADSTTRDVVAAGAGVVYTLGMSALLRLRDLVTSFHTDAGVLRAVDRVSFDVPEAVTVGLVGESGCGKSMTALSILRLVPSPGAIESGTIEFHGRDLLTLPEREIRAIRGNEISMIFQEPMTSLNPVYTVGAQIIEAIRLHRKKSRREARERALEMLRLVGIPSPDTNIDAYPHQLSGGMRQRVMIAMALACEPKLLIADEPTTALDVTIQAQILSMLRRLQEKMKMSVVLITHDLGIVAEYAEIVLVMYAGEIVEQAPVKALFAHPRHPYTRGLLESVPRPRIHSEERVRLSTIEGMVPDLRSLPQGCRFADRCPMVISACTEKDPELLPLPGEEGRLSRCLRASEMLPLATRAMPAGTAGTA